MRPKKSDRLAGIVFGSFVADSLALGTHWVYDQDELRRSVMATVVAISRRLGNFSHGLRHRDCTRDGAHGDTGLFFGSPDVDAVYAYLPAKGHLM